MDDDEERGGGKRDRVARLTRVVRLLQANPNGIRIDDLAKRLGMSKRTAYRDLVALQDELKIGTWSDNGVWGVMDDSFMPTLQLTRQEAMAIVLAARLMVRYADKYDPALASTFEKLGGVLPRALAEHVEQTLAILAKAPRDERFSDHVETLTRAWAERRVVTIDYEPAKYGPQSTRRTATVRPYLIEPSLQTHALYLIGFDEEKAGLRTFKIERIRAISMTPRTFEPPDPAATQDALRGAWDIIADQSPIDVVLRFVPDVAARVQETIWHSSQTTALEEDGSLTWRGTVAGPVEIRLWIMSWGDEVEVLEPADLRADVRDRLGRARARYEPRH